MMEFSVESSIISGKYRAQQKFIQDLYSAKWKRQLKQGIKPKWLNQKLFVLYNDVHSQASHKADRGILLTISPGTDPGMEKDTISFLHNVREKLLMYKNFIPGSDYTCEIETLQKDGVTPTHPHLHMAFPNKYLHSKTQYVNRTFNALIQVEKSYSKNRYVPTFSRQSVDVRNRNTYEVYAKYVKKNCVSDGADPGEAIPPLEEGAPTPGVGGETLIPRIKLQKLLKENLDV